MTGYVHLAAKLADERGTLLSDDVAPWLWARLRERFPDALAAVLMPRHVHVIARAEHADRLDRTLRWHARLFRPGSLTRVWEPLEPRPVIADVGKLHRQVRYVLLNPCRASFVDDPLLWRWSTHRDSVGGVADPWVPAGRLAAALERPTFGFEDWFHHYVSADPHASVGGTPPPEPDPPDVAPLSDLLAATASALRLRPDEVSETRLGRVLFTHLATNHGWPDIRHLAPLLDVTPIAARRLRRRACPPDALAAGRLCLAEPRLRAG